MPRHRKKRPKQAAATREPKQQSLWQQFKSGLWGDVTEQILSSVGLTKDKWEEIIGGKCACGERQQWLNKVGQAITQSRE